MSLLRLLSALTRRAQAHAVTLAKAAVHSPRTRRSALERGAVAKESCAIFSSRGTSRRRFSTTHGSSGQAWAAMPHATGSAMETGVALSLRNSRTGTRGKTRANKHPHAQLIAAACARHATMRDSCKGQPALRAVHRGSLTRHAALRASHMVASAACVRWAGLLHACEDWPVARCAAPAPCRGGTRVLKGL